MFDQIETEAAGFPPHTTRASCGVSTASSTVSIPDSSLSSESSGTPRHANGTMLLRGTASAKEAGSYPFVAFCEGLLAPAMQGGKVGGVGPDGGQRRLPGDDAVFDSCPDGGSVPPSSEDESSGVGGGSGGGGGGLVHSNIRTGLDALLTGCSFDPGEKGMASAASGSIPCLGPPPPPAVDGFPCEPPAPTRKRGCRDVEEDEVESKLLGPKRQKSEETDISLGFNSPPVSSVARLLRDEPTWDPCLDESADELQMLCDDFCFEMPEQQQQCSPCSKEGGGDSLPESSGSARQSRRQKIKATVQLLREAIPGGDCLDNSIVLDEAIHYVKLLQLQVQTLGAKRLASS